MLGALAFLCVSIASVQCDLDERSLTGQQRHEILIEANNGISLPDHRSQVHDKTRHKPANTEQTAAQSEILNTLESKSKRIVGGKFSKPHVYPWLVGIKLRGRQSCGGSIIAPQWILTAAHCIFDPHGKPVKASDLTVVVGDFSQAKKEKNEKNVTVSEATQHEKYTPGKPDSDFDIALLKLSQLLVYNEDVRSIKIAKAVPEGGTNCVVAGWGKYNSRNNVGGLVQKEVTLPIISNSACQKIPIMNGHPLSENAFCAVISAGGKDTCPGDSGGPLFCKIGKGEFEQAGIVSFGSSNCAEKNGVGVYQAPGRYLTWIRTKTGANL